MNVLRRLPRATKPALIALMLAAPTHAHASHVPRRNARLASPTASRGSRIVIAPIIGIAVFWLVHILPEKIAEKKKHPQTRAIQCLCLLSLVFGGLLWPIAWLWAYTKPVLHKLAYGTDVDESLATPTESPARRKRTTPRPRRGTRSEQAKGGKA